MDSKFDGLQEIIDKALASMEAESTGDFDPQKCNLAEFCRRTGLTRQRARTIKANGFRVKPHGRLGMKAGSTVLSGHTGFVDDQLRKGVTNSQVVYERLLEQGYEGGLTTVKVYMADHADLVPAKRRATGPQRGSGQRFRSGPAESYQMDWGFANVEDWAGRKYRVACFAMVCHHCGTPYVEFFPNARQENLFIGMLHAFARLGVPDGVLTDNMKSVVSRRDAEGRPVWNGEYEAFMDSVGFTTRLCKPRHPFTKGKVERLVRFVKESFLAGRTFEDLDSLNRDALDWCDAQAGRYRRSVGHVPAEVHSRLCSARAREVRDPAAAERYLCPLRRISFDGFVSFEGGRYGVPYWYSGSTCRVSREGGTLHIFSEDLSRELVCHEVDRSRADSWCDGQWPDSQPEESPSQEVTTTVTRAKPKADTAFAKFDFSREVM